MMVKKESMSRGEAVLGILTLCLGPLHLMLIIPNGIGLGYGGYSLWSYALSGLYMLTVLGTDCFMLCNGRFELARALRRYWGSSIITVALAVVLTHIPFPPLIDGAGMGGLLMLYTPYLIVVPVMEWLGFSADNFMLGCGYTAVFCIANWGICRFFVRDCGR